MHLWSLSIDEQFYLVYPALILLLGHTRKRLVVSLVLLFLASMTANVWRTQSDSASAFFLPHYRAWELLAGSLTAFVSLWNVWPGSGKHVQEGRLHTVLRHLSSSAGLLLVIAAVALISRNLPYPGWRALLPVCGTSLIILAGPRAIANRFVLSNKALVFVGLISYPLYLWLWPLLSFGHIIESSQPAAWVRAALLAVSFGLAFATYRYIEIPIRYGRRTWLIPAALTAALLGIGVMGYRIYDLKGIRACDRRSSQRH